MKRPFSSSALSSSEADGRPLSAAPVDEEPRRCDGLLLLRREGLGEGEEPSPGGALPSPPHRPKRERKQRSYTLCEVCNIQLNSAVQAQIHYNGKSHQKRLKQLSNGKAAVAAASNTDSASG
ncbi:zinc finger matrin-type protein 3-like [Nelusetta ayraudi]|uniref:zinc finger matrin-type protein 3-like n=1 Tax=Nelusetta ayraudi TaxID=303726 RepID=UPI003F71224E